MYIGEEAGEKDKKKRDVEEETGKEDGLEDKRKVCLSVHGEKEAGEKRRKKRGKEKLNRLAVLREGKENCGQLSFGSAWRPRVPPDLPKLRISRTSACSRDAPPRG